MLWLILLGISILFIVLGCIIEKIGEFFAPGIMGFIIFSIIVICVAANGYTDYPNLKMQYKQIESYRNRIVDIKNATYKISGKGEFVAISGSLENLQQSTNLSKYLSELAGKEAEYFGNLEKCKTYKEMFFGKFIADGLFISGKIYELPTK